MAKTQFLDLTGLSQYDELIKQYIDAADAGAVKSGKIDGNVITLYAGKNGTGAIVSTITLPDVDLDDYLTKIDNGIEGNVVVVGEDGVVEDSDVSLSSLATKAEVTTVDTKVGDVTGLDTNAKSNVVGAINELKDAIDNNKTAGAVTIDDTSTSEDYAKVYTVKQGEQVVGTINIPKDLVVKSGAVVNKGGKTYIELTLNDEEEDVISIDVGTLVDIYTSEAEAAKVQVTVDNDTRKISATLVSSSVTSTELADGAVVTTKIVDANVTLAKLADDAKNAFDSAGSATAAEINAKNYAKGLDDATNGKVDALSKIVGDGVEAIPTSDISALFD